MRTKKKLKSRYIIVSKVGCLVACMTDTGLKLRPMEHDTKPFYFLTEARAIETIASKKTIADLVVVETKEW